MWAACIFGYCACKLGRQRTDISGSDVLVLCFSDTSKPGRSLSSDWVIMGSFGPVWFWSNMFVASCPFLP